MPTAEYLLGRLCNHLHPVCEATAGAATQALVVGAAAATTFTGFAIVGAIAIPVVIYALVTALRDRETESKILGAGEPDLSVSRLWEGAQTRLSMYHQLAVIQGRQSFRMLLLFSGLGFGLLTFVVWSLPSLVCDGFCGAAF